MGTLNVVNPKTLDTILVRRFEGETSPETGEIIQFVVKFDRGYKDVDGKFTQVGQSEGIHVPKEVIDKLIPVNSQKALVVAFDQFVSKNLQ